MLRIGRRGFLRGWGRLRPGGAWENGDVRAAISREKEIKAWGRMKKIRLIESTNRDWKDLSEGWYGRREEAKDRSRDAL